MTYPGNNPYPQQATFGPTPQQYPGYPPQYQGYQQAYPYRQGMTPPGYGYQGPVQGPPQGLAITSMVLGLCGIVAWIVWPVALVLAILAVIFGHVSLSKEKYGQAGGHGMAVTGVVLGYVFLGLVLAIVILTFTALASIGLL